MSADPSGELGAAYRYLRKPEPGLSQVTRIRAEHETLANRSLARTGLFPDAAPCERPLQGGKRSRNFPVLQSRVDARAGPSPAPCSEVEH